MNENIITLPVDGDGSDDIIATNAEDPSSTLKQLLLERWNLLLNLFGLFPDDKIVRANSTDENQKSPPTAFDFALDHGSNAPSANAFSADAYAAAVGMVDTACKERGPLTADEGAALRAYFQAEGLRLGHRQGVRQRQEQGQNQGEAAIV